MSTLKQPYALSKRPRRLKILFLLLTGLVMLSYNAWRYYWPLESSDVLNRIELWRAGVRSAQRGGLHVFVHDLCEKSEGEGSESSVSAGDCTCVALVHGLGDTAQTWKRLLLAPRKSWRGPVRLYAWDLPGAGDSPVPLHPSDYRAQIQASTLDHALAEVSECPRWTVVGNSLGGWLAPWMLLKTKPAQAVSISRLLLLDPAGIKPTVSESPSLLEKPTLESMKQFQKKAYAHPRELPDFVWKAVVEKMKDSQVPQIRAAQTPEDFLDGPEFGKAWKAQFHSRSLPILILHGQRDQITPQAEAESITKILPGSKLREVPDCGHLPQKECPQVVMKTLNEFLYGEVDPHPSP